jgi:hypothetical protein
VKNGTSLTPDLSRVLDSRFNTEHNFDELHGCASTTPCCGSSKPPDLRCNPIAEFPHNMARIRMRQWQAGYAKLLTTAAYAPHKIPRNGLTSLVVLAVKLSPSSNSASPEAITPFWVCATHRLRLDAVVDVVLQVGKWAGVLQRW